MWSRPGPIQRIEIVPASVICGAFRGQFPDTNRRDVSAVGPEAGLNASIWSSNRLYLTRSTSKTEASRPSFLKLATAFPLPLASTAKIKPDARTSTLLTRCALFEPHPTTNVDTRLRINGRIWEVCAYVGKSAIGRKRTFGGAACRMSGHGGKRTARSFEGRPDIVPCRRSGCTSVLQKQLRRKPTASPVCAVERPIRSRASALIRHAVGKYVAHEAADRCPFPRQPQ